MAQDHERRLVPLGTALEHIHQVGVRVVLHVFTVNLQDNVPLQELGAARVVHDQLNNGPNGRLACRDT